MLRVEGIPKNPMPEDEGSRTRLGIAPPPLRDGGTRRARPADGNSTMPLPEPARLGAELVKLGPGVQVPGTSYRVTGWIGDGAMGVVYSAEHVELERKVALKILRPDASRSPAFAEMFRREAKNASKIGSHYIVEVFDLGELPDGRVWFTMPMLQGRSLRALAVEESLDPGRVIGILRQVCKGLAAAHDAGIIHRDVKPENIMVVEDRGRRDAVRMLDWGVAAMSAEAAGGGGTVAGTPYYIAPELVAGLPYDHRADLYSLGCTAFEMIAGHPPFQGPTLDDILAAHVERQAPPLEKVAPNPVPAALAKVVAKCMAKNAANRYANANELEAALCEAQIAAKLHTTWDDLPLPDIDPERRASIAAKMPDPTTVQRRRRWLPALGLAAVVAVATSAVIVAVRDPATSEDRSEVDTKAQQARAAAAKSFFLFPPPDAPETRTAYEVVRELESFEGTASKAGQAQAQELREEFAATLLRLGDYYWEHEGGRPFAIDYYAQALVFQPTLPRARDRAGLTPGELIDLRQRAETKQFSAGELLAARSLVALAEEDPQARARGLAEISETEELSLRAGAQLDALLAGDPELERATEVAVTELRQSRPGRRTKAPAETTDEGPEVADAAGEGSGDPAGEDAGGGFEKLTDDAVEPGFASKQRDRATAVSEVQTADAALGRGDLSRAEKAYERAVAADDRYAPAFDGLARLEFHRGNYVKAVRHGEKAVRLSPRNGKYRIDLGDAYYKAYRYDDAIAQYEKADAYGQGSAKARISKAKAKLGT